MRGYTEDGFAVDRQVFSPDEIAMLRDHFMAMMEAGGRGFVETPIDLSSDDPLRRFPRLLHPHRGDEVSLSYMLDDRLRERLTALMGEEPLAAQTMVYFKPPGAKGQALHQDQRYLRVQPDPLTCMAAWLALDDCDEENGCLEVVPGTHELPMLCPTPSDSNVSFTSEHVEIPPGKSVVPVLMKAGDVLFFNGSLIHGSHPNRTKDRFRRSFICHYISGSAEGAARFYHPCLRFDGSEVELEQVPYGGACGTYRDGELVMHSTIEDAVAAH